MIIKIICINTFSIEIPFKKGVNLTGWFQASSVELTPFTRFTKQDFVNIKNLGCDVIRLPINLHAMTSGEPVYAVSPLFFRFLDSAVTWAENLKLYLIIDNHTFDPNVNTPTDIDKILRKVWVQVAKRYKNRSPYILYEVLNEPHGPSTQEWGRMQKTVIDTIRTVDTKHTIIVGASSFNNYNELDKLPYYSDTNLIYTYHFYDPFMFTHQGASWVDYMDSLKGVPYPYSAERMQECPSSAKGSWVDDDLKKYVTSGTDSAVKKLLDIAVAFRDKRKVPVFCGEFGVLNLFADTTDRAYWYKMVSHYLDSVNISWTIWDYKGSFGIFKKGSSEMFKSDVFVPLTQSLGFNAPIQQSAKIEPDSVGFSVYEDFIGEKIIDYSWADLATLNFYDTISPNYGDYSVCWQNPKHYSKIAFNFIPSKDLSRLKQENYAIDLFTRSSNVKTKFELRFVQKKSSTTDHPWRMSYTFSLSNKMWDGYASCSHSVLFDERNRCLG